MPVEGDFLSDATIDTFSPHIGSEFRIGSGDESVAIRLAAVNELGRGAPPANLRRPFSLLFIGPSSRRVEQKTYEVIHDQLGRFDLFLVPVEPTPEGPQLEAIFT